MSTTPIPTATPTPQAAVQAADPKSAASAPVESTSADSQEVDSADDAATTEADQTAEQKELKKKVEKEIKKWKLKVDGHEQELTEDELIKNAQLGKAAYKRMQEAAELRKNVDQFFDILRKDPLKILQDPNLGIDIKKIAEQVINSELEDMQKTPEQKEKERLQRELEEIKEKFKKDEETRKEAEMRRLEEQAAVQIDHDITSALKDSGLPKSPYVVKKMAEAMMLAMQNNIDLSAKDVVPLIKKQIMDEVRDMFSSSPEEIMEEILGKDNISRLRKRNIQKMKQPVQNPNEVKNTGNDVKAKSQEEKKKIPLKDFLKGLG